MFQEYAMERFILPGYMRTWFSKTHNFDDKAFLKGELLKESHALRTKQQIWNIAKTMADVSRKKDF